MSAGSAIMESLDHVLVNGNGHGEIFLSAQSEDGGRYPGNGMLNSGSSKTSIPDVVTHDLQSLNLHGGGDDCRSFLLLDQDEELCVESVEAWCNKLGCDVSETCKVVSILGNTGEGKSHTLNHTFFAGAPVFNTSNQQESCTTGVWASFDPDLQVLILDTEGMLGRVDNENIRTRMLLKVLAISDLVIYRTRAERLHNDMFYFLGDASRAYIKHFKLELDKMGEQNFKSEDKIITISASNLGPTTIIFHETLHTEVLGKQNGRDPESSIRERFSALKQDISAFSKIKYVGTRSDVTGRTNFGALREVLVKELKDTSVRSARNVQFVYHAMEKLNAKFSGNLVETSHRCFPDEYFTCPAKCKENGRRCIVVPKASSSKEGSIIGLAKYAWSGYVLECQKCGVIYRSRQQWYGNTDPEYQGIVHTEIAHVWPGVSHDQLVYSVESFAQVRSLQGTQNAARRLLDSMTALSGTVSEVSSAPAASIGRWAADQVAPAYWRPNADIINCHHCNKRFDGTEKIHHCRACGEGFCSKCSNFQRPVPDRGWGYAAVRVCKPCYNMTADERIEGGVSNNEPNEVQVRKVGETVYGTVSSLATAFEFPINIIKDSARPDYWVPDSEITKCSVCDKDIGNNMSTSQSSSSSQDTCTRVHHCRQCGQGVCNACSSTRRPVPHRGWDTPVRVCDDCLLMP